MILLSFSSSAHAIIAIRQFAVFPANMKTLIARRIIIHACEKEAGRIYWVIKSEINMHLLVVCPKCSKTVSIEYGDERLVESYCPSCSCKFEMLPAPAAGKALKEGRSPDKVERDDESSCFFHPDKKAVSHCSTCGAFLCSLCEIAAENKLLCPNCFNSAKKEISSFSSEAFLYDELFLLLSLIGILTCHFGLILSPIAIIGSIYFWNRIKTPYPRRRWRFVLAIALSSFQLLVWALVIASVLGVVSFKLPKF